MARTTYFRASMILVAMMAAALVAMLAAQKPAAGIPIDDGICLSGCSTPPDTTITSGPANFETVSSAVVSFAFSSNQSGSTFQCKLDNGTFESCTSPKEYTGISEGWHTFAVRAVSSNGTDTSPASRTWLVNATAPTVSTVLPADQTRNVVLDTNVEVVFSDAMDRGTLTASTFTLTKHGSSTPVASTVGLTPQIVIALFPDTSNTKKATLDPSSELAPNTTYTVTVKGGSSGARDVAGTALEHDYTWSFTTEPDTTAPITTRTLSPQPNAAGWHKENVTLTLSATDNASGVKEISYSINGGQTVTEEQDSVQIAVTNEGETTISYHAADSMGNAEAPKILVVKLDKTAPQITPGDVVSDVWRNGPLSKQFTASDGGSGLADSADASFTLTASEASASENQPTVASRTVADAAGNFTTRTVSALIDLTKPEVTASLSSQPTAAGWHKDNVTAILEASDPVGGSGIKEITYSVNGAQTETIAGDTANIPISDEGITTISYSAKDNAGSAAAPGAITVKLDKSAPTLDAVTPGNRQTGVSRKIEPTATFSDEMELASLRTSAKLYQWNAKMKVWQRVPVAVSVEDKTAALDPYPADPSRLLAANKRFRVTVSTGATNLAGIPMSTSKSWTFTTGTS